MPPREIPATPTDNSKHSQQPQALPPGAPLEAFPERELRSSDVRELAPGRAGADVDELMRKFYSVVSFPEGGSPDWQGMEALFSKRARVTRVTPEGIDYLDFEGFRSLAEELIEVGAFTSFYELETARRTDRFGDVLHMASAYVTKVSPRARDYIERGVNSLQLIREQGEWKILSLCWDVAAPFNQSGLEPVAQEEVPYGQS
jgi:hypothetical protein